MCIVVGDGAPCFLCHSERSEESRPSHTILGLVLNPNRICRSEILRFAQNDKSVVGMLTPDLWLYGAQVGKKALETILATCARVALLFGRK